jgi:hypothetical protein
MSKCGIFFLLDWTFTQDERLHVFAGKPVRFPEITWKRMGWTWAIRSLNLLYVDDSVYGKFARDALIVRFFDDNRLRCDEAPPQRGAERQDCDAPLSTETMPLSRKIIRNCHKLLHFIRS